MYVPKEEITIDVWCEIRSGPEYVIRHFHFQTNNTFQTVVYRYFDPDCHRPMYAIESRGTHRLTQASWTVKGGTEAEYEVISSYIIPYTVNATLDLSRRLSEGCRNVGVVDNLVTYNRYLIYSLSPHLDHLSFHGQGSNPDGDVDCFHALNFTLHELQLVMLELRRHRPSLHQQHQQHRTEMDNDMTGSEEFPFKVTENQFTRELLLGAVHSKPEERQSHRPSSFQTALKEGHVS
ncbi:Protein apcdd1 [Bulinus truncatus]|nr:Protein apcdd1 [Bulinus truncatus]